MEGNKLTFTEKTTGNWDKIFKEFVGNNERLRFALERSGKHVPSPFNLGSKKDGFRMFPDYQNKNGLGWCETNGAMSGVKMISFLTGQTENQVASNIHKLMDGKTMDVLKIKAEIATANKQRENRDLQKLEFNKKLIKDILKQPSDNTLRDKYLKNRGLKDAIPFINKDLIGIDNLYYDKDNKFPAMVSVVRNEDNKIAFLHRTFLDKDGNKANVDDVKKVTGKTREDAYQRPFYATVNNPIDSSNKNIHICEGIETALAVSILTKNKDTVISTVNAHGITKYEPPVNTKSVTIWADNDAKGMESAIRLQSSLLNGGVKIEIKLPKVQGHDFLNQLNAKTNKANTRANNNKKGRLR